jgi:hypothetical protein
MATLQWNSGNCVTDYYLYIGSTVGSNDIVGKDEGQNLSDTFSGLPVDGRTLYVRLWSLVNGGWAFNDYTYKAAGSSTCWPVPAAITSPAPGSVLPGPTVTFQWNSGNCVTDYRFYIGNTVGFNDIVDKEEGQNLSDTFSGLPVDGRTLYVRLWSLIKGVWKFDDYTYKAAAWM